MPMEFQVTLTPLGDLTKASGIRRPGGTHRAVFAPATKLPPELVCHILRYALPDDYVSGSRESVPWILGHICRSWRVTALADSFLWSFIALSTSHPQPSAHLVAALECQLSRTNEVPLSVFISGGTAITQEALSILYPTAPRWRHLRLHRIDELSWITELRDHLPSLERLEFIDSGTVGDVFSQNVPRLRIVDLFEAGFSDYSPVVALPFSQLTHYREAWSYETHAINLSDAENLEVCVLGTVDAQPLPLPQTAHLPRLRALHLDSLHFLQYITAPVLEHLAMFPDTEDPQILENVLPFLQQSACVGTLRRLALMQCAIDGSDILELFRTLSSLEALVLEFVLTDSDPSTILAALTIGDDEHVICPKLASLTYGHLGAYETFECLDMLPALARSRAQFLSRPSRRFELYIYQSWSGYVVTLPIDMFKFERLADDGVDLFCMSSTDPRVVKERWGDF